MLPAGCHTARDSLHLLPVNFGNRVISRVTDFPYPSNSFDLTPPYTYIEGILKEVIFRENPPEDTCNEDEVTNGAGTRLI